MAVIAILAIPSKAQWVTSVVVSPAGVSAVVNYTTCAPATVEVAWGQSVSYGSNTGWSTGLANTHTSTMVRLVPGMEYHYQIRAKDATGAQANSVDHVFTTKPATVSLSWSSVASANTYNVRRATVSGGPYTIVASNLTSNSYTDTAIAANQSYYYVATAVNSQGESKYSNQVVAKIP